MAKKHRHEEKEAKAPEKFESLKDKTGDIRKEKLEKAIELDGKKKVEAVRDAKKGVPVLYAGLIVAVIAVIAGVLIFSMPGFVNPPAGAAAKAGDVVQILYVGMLSNGSVFDSGNFTFKIGAGEAIQGVDEAVVGMRAGEKKTVTIKPDKAYGYYDEFKIYDVPLDSEMNKTDKLTVDQFNLTFGEEPVLQKLYTLEGREWDPMRVAGIDNQTVTVSHQAQNGTVFDLKDVVGNVYGTAEVRSSDGTIRIHSSPVRGAVVITFIGRGKIVDLNETHMKMDFNHPLASETLTFEMTLANVIPY